MVNNKRYLGIACGYYEWQSLNPQGKVKQKYKLRLPNEELFAFADLYSHWVDKETGEIKIPTPYSPPKPIHF